MRMAAGFLGLFLACVVEGLAPRGVRAQVITLAELERQAVQGRPVLDANDAATRGADADVDRARAAYYPVVSIEGKAGLSPGNVLRKLPCVPDPEDDETCDTNYVVSATREDGELDGEAFAPVFRYGLGLEARMNIYDFGRTSSSVSASRAKRAAVEADRDVTRMKIVKLVRASYLAWLAANELLSVTEVASADAKGRSTRVSALISEGMRPKADLTPVRSDELLAELELARARGDVAKRKLQLEHAVGAALPEGALPDRTLLEYDGSTRDADDPELRALELERNAADKAADAYDKGDNAVLGGLGSVGMYGQTNSIFPNYNVGVSLSVPLWDGGGDEASASSARAHKAGIDAQIRQHELARTQEQREVAVDTENASRRLATAEALLASTTVQLEEAEARYDLGGGGIEPIAVARAMMRRAHTELLLAKIARAEAALRALP
jgi:outer membrane protein, multidrug efflux system